MLELLVRYAEGRGSRAWRILNEFLSSEKGGLTTDDSSRINCGENNQSARGGSVVVYGPQLQPVR